LFRCAPQSSGRYEVEDLTFLWRNPDIIWRSVLAT
jgi:hypothetical protein